ncbi:MAG: hypothetical protein Q9214_001315 [Letrouitia sp. 1 TL-2023]
MNPSDPGQRIRGPTNGVMGGPGRPMQDHRNMSGPGGGSASHNPTASMSRAERFEDEKRRIMESCFSKKDPDGSISESYITHIRVVEDAAYPSNPPPPQSPESNKKPRIIIVAVRKTGRVRMHKARGNANGTFSIGKTWNLDDLSAIQSYTNSVPVTPEEREDKQRAAGIGFVVTITKPYYWQAATAKEKEFFIFSLIKIYKKYTGGKLPELLGFDPQELEAFAGAAGPHPVFQQRLARPAEGPRPEPEPFPSNAPPSRPPQPQSRPPPPSQMQPQPQPQIQPQIPPPPRQRPPMQGERSQSGGREPRSQPLADSSSQPQPYKRPSQERSLRTADSDERMPYIPGSFPSTSQPHLKTKRSESPALRNQALFQQEQNGHAINGAPDVDNLQNGPYRVLHSARPSDERSRQNQNANAGPRHDMFIQQQSRAPSSESVPRSLKAGGPPSSRPSQESLMDRGRPPLGEVKQTSAVSKALGAQPADDPSESITGLDRNREPSIDQPRRSNDIPRTGLMPPALKSSVSNDSRYSEDSRPSTATKASSSNGAPSFDLAENHDIDAPEASAPTSIPTPPETPTESHRPGLGPMIKAKRSNKDIAAKFRNAANAYNSFKPRVGGAADKLREKQTSPTGEPDGITSVIPAPSLARPQPNQQDSSNPVPDLRSQSSGNEIPVVTVDSPPSKPLKYIDTQPPTQDLSPPPDPVTPATAKQDAPEKAQEEQRRNRNPDHSSKYATILGIDPGVLAGRTFDVDSTLNELGWGEETNERCSYNQLQDNIRKELSRAEVGSWLTAIEQNDDRVTVLGSMMDRVVAECEELDCLLTLYGVELSTLGEDVAYIEAQSQGLQVQAANQKLLHSELQMLLETISISASDLGFLRESSLTKPQGIQAVESTLTQLYTAMLTIDPKERQRTSQGDGASDLQRDRRTSGGFGGTELSSMRAVREKKLGYQKETKDFVQRFKQYISIKFREAETETLDVLDTRRSNSMASNPPRLDHRLRERPREGLWPYSPLVLFARELEPFEWEDMIHMYETTAKKPYQEEFRDHAFAWKRITRKLLGDDQDVLFTSQEKESESIVGRKLTVKRSKTIRTDGSNRVSSGEKPKDGKVDPYEAFAGALNEMVRVLFVEQNFVVDYFHVTSLDNTDFVDAINSTKPAMRTGTDLMEKKLFDPDRDMARKVTVAMEDIFSFWSTDLQNLGDWVVSQGPLQGIGVITTLESKVLELEETNQEFLIHTLNKAHDRLTNLFSRFIDEQIHAIEETKVKIKKRKGVIAFMKTFPNFCVAVESMLPPPPLYPIGNETLPIRSLVDSAYNRLNKAMFESLQFIATESPSFAAAATAAPSGDPEDKEALNYHILLIENMNHYLEEVPTSSSSSIDNPVLLEWKSRAQSSMQEHLDLYLGSVLRRPLGKVLDFVESMETLLSELPSENATTIATRPSHSRGTFKKVLSGYDSKEVRKGIEALKKRVEKHFGEADEVELARSLVGKVLKECEARYLAIGERVRGIAANVYEGSVEVEWKDEDVKGGFRR